MIWCTDDELEKGQEREQMAINFTVKEAKQLIDRHKALLSNLDYIASKAVSIITDIRWSANNLVTQAILKRLVIDDCVHPTDSLARNAEVERLIYGLYKYQMMRSAIEMAKTYKSYTAANVRQNITLLNPGLAGMSWFFGGK